MKAQTELEQQGWGVKNKQHDLENHQVKKSTKKSAAKTKKDLARKNLQKNITTFIRYLPPRSFFHLQGWRQMPLSFIKKRKEKELTDLEWCISIATVG
jgi:hypothetical protein